MSVTQDQADWFARRVDALRENLERVIQGKRDVVRLGLTCLFAEGHLLIEDVPGVGKTSLARALAASIDLSWHRIQFTPDLLPSDVTGVSIYNQATRTFEFKPGAVFANVVVADEINRASPKTQSALLEVMQEHNVTVDAVPHPVPRPFMVIASQNPIDMHGTYRLPEAQLDRFLLRVRIGYPDIDAEIRILETQRLGSTVDELRAVLTLDELRTMIRFVTEVHVAPAVQRYIAQVSASTRSLPGVLLGVSPRGSLALMRAARAHAAIDGRSYVVPEDVKAIAVPALGHRVILSPRAELQGRTGSQAIDQVLRDVPVPQRLPQG